MKHPSPEHWSAYVRGIVDQGEATTLEEHLDSGCNRCEQQLGALRSVLRVAQTDLRIEPPAYAARSVRNLFRVQRLLEEASKPTFKLDLSFDSFLVPVAAGTRGGVAESRHLVYESPELTLDIQVQSGHESEPIRVVGQVLDSEASPMMNIPAFLYQGGRIFSQDLSGSMGEFRLLGDSHSSPHLCLLIGDEQLVDLELPSLLKETGSTH